MAHPISEGVEKTMRKMLKEFDDFSSALIEGTIPELAPPFDSYSSHTGDIISYLDAFYGQYLSRLKAIRCLPKVNEGMRLFVDAFRSSHGIAEPTPAFDLYAEAESVCRMIHECLVLTFKGFPADAFEHIEKMMTARGCHLANLLPQVQKVQGRQRMYRVRRGKHSHPKELFHVPFECRTQCDSYRFSIAGVPALYGATTLRTAMLETGISHGDELSAAIFDYGRDYEFTFVDLTIPRRPDYGLWERYSMIVFYPLIVACGLRVKEPCAPFKPEYVISQLLYQFVRSHSDFDGIIYNSTKYAKRDFADHDQNNYVVFVRNCDQEKGYSDVLAAKMEVCGPIQFIYRNDAEITAIQSHLRSLSPVPLTI